MKFDPIKLEIFKNLFAAIADEMGGVLQKSSYSPNIKERRDFSCAVFNAQGQLIAQASHIPVHLGAMPLSVKEVMDQFEGNLATGDLIVLNNPYQGGTHLPDITMVSPVFFPSLSAADSEGIIIGYVASHAHHSDVGGMTPGSMPLAKEIYQEGLIIPPIKLIQNGQMDSDIFRLILYNVRTPEERHGDFLAQIAANQRGVSRLADLYEHYGTEEISNAMNQLLLYTDRMTRKLLKSLPDGDYFFSDVLDNDGISSTPVPIAVKISIRGEKALVDFTGSAPQQKGSVNAVKAITISAVLYVFRCLLGLDVPNNAGCLIPIEIIAPSGSVVNAKHPSPVAGGNVETSQRIVDVLLGALAKACPKLIPAASQGTMNNIAIGGSYPSSFRVSEKGESPHFVYYETVGGGMGARPNADGVSAIHSHMTNTLNTPIEALEFAYPIRIHTYAIREGSGGEGKYKGGDGIIREMELLTDCQVTLLTDRRISSPYGLAGGEPGACGNNSFMRDGVELPLPSKGTFPLFKGDILSICTPGGGGYGVKPL